MRPRSRLIALFVLMPALALLPAAPAASAIATCGSGQQSYMTSSGVVCAPTPVPHFGFVAQLRGTRIVRLTVSPTAKGQKVVARCTQRCRTGRNETSRKAKGKSTTLDLEPLRVKKGSAVEVTVSAKGHVSRRVFVDVLPKAPYVRNAGEGCLVAEQLKPVRCAPAPAPTATPTPAPAATTPVTATPAVVAEPPIGLSPIGKLLGVERLAYNVVRVTGWALDPDTPQTKVSVVGVDNTTIGGTAVADLDRTDVGGGHGYLFTVAVNPLGTRLCVRAKDLGQAGDGELGCKELGNGYDVTGNGCVGQGDINLITRNFRAVASDAAGGDPNTNIYWWGDVNGDATVDIYDLSIVSNQYDSTCPVDVEAPTPTPTPTP